jgi:cell division protein FtsQ
MSSDYLYRDAVPGGEGNGARGERDSRVNRWLVRLVMVIAFILAAELVWLFGITPLLPLAVLEVDGLPGIDRAWILEQAGIGPGASWIAVNAREAERRLSRLYLVEAAHVIKEYPGTVRIFLEPRRPVALSLAEREGRLVPVYFDKHGMIIQIGDVHAEASSSLSLPILSGFTINNLNPGWQIHLLENLLLALDNISLSAPELLRAVSEIRINNRPYSGYDLVIYPVNSAVRFRVNQDITEDVLRYIILMLDVFDKSDVSASEVDLRSGTASFVTKEASSG